ncbi:MAG: hypothetical protein HC841_00690 [Verrucomicrobiae bacterium]|nr:hypothetical protein [Verrucomicrobiae bacterium]
MEIVSEPNPIERVIALASDAGEVASGSVYYNPGIKLENASTAEPKSKKRSQFRVASRNITALYETVETVEV